MRGSRIDLLMQWRNGTRRGVKVPLADLLLHACRRAQEGKTVMIITADVIERDIVKHKLLHEHIASWGALQAGKFLVEDQADDAVSVERKTPGMIPGYIYLLLPAEVNMHTGLVNSREGYHNAVVLATPEACRREGGWLLEQWEQWS